MSFNRRGGPDRRGDRPDRAGRSDRDRYDRPPRESGDWQPRDRGGGDRPFTPRPGGGPRPFTPRPRFDRAPDEGGMSIRLDPRRLGILKQLAGEAGARPGDLVRGWVEERIDAERLTTPGGGGMDLATRLARIDARIASLEAAIGTGLAATPAGEPAPGPVAADTQPSAAPEPAPLEAEAAPEPTEEPVAEETPPRRRGGGAKRVTAAPEPRVALHDEMIAALREMGPMTAAELAAAVTARGRYTPPRSGKPLDAAMISQRVSNPAYRARFTRAGGRIGLAEGAA